MSFNKISPTAKNNFAKSSDIAIINESLVNKANKDLETITRVSRLSTFDSPKPSVYSYSGASYYASIFNFSIKEDGSYVSGSSTIYSGSYDIQSQAYGNGVLLGNMTNVYTPYYSRDLGATWSLVPGWGAAPVGRNLIRFVNGTFWGIAENDSSLYSSSDGLGWTKVVDGTLPSTNWAHLVYGNGKYLMMGNQYSLQYVWSSDGISWNTVSLPFSQSTQNIDLQFASGKFILVVGGSSNVYSSTNGINWTTHSLPSTTLSKTLVNYLNGNFIIMSNPGSAPSARKTFIASASDLSSWTEYTLGGNQYVFMDNSLVVDNELFIQVSNGNILKTKDGITWSSAGYNQPNSSGKLCYIRNGLSYASPLSEITRKL